MANLTYKKTGVDIGKAGKLIKKISSSAKKTINPSVLSGIGRFAACYKIVRKYKEPVLVSSTDGVGTKILIAEKLGKFDSIGIDLVAMVVNDIITIIFSGLSRPGKNKGKKGKGDFKRNHQGLPIGRL